MDTPEKSEKLSTEPYKGVRDFYPSDMRSLQRLFAVWREAAQSYGYEEYGASPLEPTELYLSKTSEEIVRNQAYTFTDRGDRQVTLRPEMTPTVSRMLAAKYRDIPMPARWFSIPNVFRYERPQRGRLREHYQLNVDIFGCDSLDAEVELILVARRILTKLGVPERAYVIKLNSRAALNTSLANAGFDAETAKEVTRLIDRKEKIDNFEEELEKLAPGFKLDTNEPDDVAQVRSMLQKLGVSNVVFDPFLARGFDYYTGVVFEIFATDGKNNRSLFGGGRYNGLTKHFGAPEIAAAGFGMGDVVILDLLETLGVAQNLATATDIHVCQPEGTSEQIQTIVEQWRDAGCTVSLDVSGKKIGDQIKYADKLGIPYIVVIGDEEISSGKVKLKRLSDASEREVEIANVPQSLGK